MDNVIRTYNTVLSTAVPSEITLAWLCARNADLLRGCPLEEGVVPGQLREHPVWVGKVYRAPDASDCAQLMDGYLEWLNRAAPPPDWLSPLQWAVLRAMLAHLLFVGIHPFGDGNGRTARLLELSILIRDNAPTPAAHLMSNYYNITRATYYDQLNRAMVTGEVVPFLIYAATGFVEALRAQLDLVRDHQLGVAWESYLSTHFQDEHTAAMMRRHALVLRLPHDEGLSRLDIMRGRARDLYLGRTDKMLARDLNWLAQNGLVRHTDGEYRANRSLMEAFLPAAARVVSEAD